MSKIMSASSQNVAVEEQHQSQAPGSQQEIIEPNMNASSDESDDGCSGAKVGTVGLVGLIAGGVLGYVGHCKYENYQHQAAVDAYIAHENADAEEAANAGEGEVAEEGENSVSKTSNASVKPSAASSNKSNATEKSQVESQIEGEAEEEDKVAFTVNDENYLFCKILAPMEEDEQVVDEEGDEETSKKSKSASVGSKMPSASKNSKVASEAESTVASEVEGETEEEEKEELPKLNKQYVNLKKAYVTKEVYDEEVEKMTTAMEKMETEKVTEFTNMETEKNTEIDRLTKEKEVESQRANTAEKNLADESKRAAGLDTEVKSLSSKVEGSSKKYKALQANLKKVCGDNVPTLQSLKSLKNERVDALNIAVNVHELATPMIGAGEEVSEGDVIEISKLNVKNNAMDFQRSLKEHICAPHMEFNNEELKDEKLAYTTKIDELTNNLALKKTLTSYKQDSTVFKFLFNKSSLLIKDQTKTEGSEEKTDLELNGDKINTLYKDQIVEKAALGIQKNLQNEERIRPAREAFGL